MEDWKEIWSLEDNEAVQLAAAQTLQDSGITLPRGGAHGAENTVPLSHGAFFGVSLECGWQPTLTYLYNDSTEFQLPRFFVEAVRFLECHSTREGIFRKAGSVARQKALKATLDSGNPSIPSDSNVHDVACLLKQYLRELPEPLITSHLLPVFEASYSLLPQANRQRCLLLACLLLPQIHLQCLCVLMKLLHCVSERCSESLMDASNLAIVLAPNIIRPNINYITPSQGNPLKNQAAIIQMLIESSRWIGHVPPEVCTLSETIQEDLAHTCSMETVLDSSKNLPSRYVSSKNKKQRTSTISGLVLGLGNRLLSKGGVASESGDSHVTSVKRRTSMKRHSSADDLICNESTKRRATQLDSAPQPHPPAGIAFTPDQPHKHKRRHLLLSRHRHSASRRNKSSSKSSRFNFSQQKFFNFRFTPKPAQQEVGGASSHGNKIVPTQQFVYRGQGLDEVEGHSYKSKLLDPSMNHQHTPSISIATTTQQSSSQEKCNVHIAVVESNDNENSSGQNHTGDAAKATTTFDAAKANFTCDATKLTATNSDAATVGVAMNYSLDPVIAACTVPHVPSDRPTKKVKCDIKWGEDDSISGGADPSLKIPASKSDFSIEGGAEKVQTTGDQSPFKFLTPKGIPSSKSHPTFPFSQPRQCGQQGVKFPFLNAQNEHIEQASFPFTPHLGGTSKNFQFLDPQNDSIQKASFPFTPYPSLKPSKTPPSDDLYTYSFANPTPLNPRTLTSQPLGSEGEASLVGEKSIVQNLNKAFVNDSQFNDESFPSGSIHLPTVVPETTPSISDNHAHKTNTNAKAAILRRLSSIHGKGGTVPLDDAFLQTPFLLSTNSPNLLEKITSEIAIRHQFSPPPSDPSSSLEHPSKPIPNTGSSSISSEGSSVAKEDTSDHEEQMDSGDDGGAILGTTDKEMFKRLVLRVNDSYKKAMEEDEGESLLPRVEEGDTSSVASSASSKDDEAMDVARLKSEESISIGGGESDCFDNLLPQKLKFDSSTCTCDSDVSLQSGLEASAPVIQHSNTAAEVKSNSLSMKTGKIKSPNVMKAKKMRSRQLVTPRSSARRTMAYSATLGLSEQLLTTRDPGQLRKPAKQPNATLSNRAHISSASQQHTQPQHKSNTTSAILSASLGITGFSLGGTGQGATRTNEKGASINSQKSTPDTGNLSNTSQQKIVEESSVQNISPTPAILHILEANSVTSQAKESSDKPPTSDNECRKTNRQRRRMSKSKSMNSLKQSSENKGSGVKSAQGKVYSNDEPVNYKFKAIGGKVESECSIVTRDPSPRLPFGLKSPWFRLMGNKDDRTKDNQDEKINKRAQSYIVNGPVPIPHSGHASLKKTDETSHYHDDGHVI